MMETVEFDFEKIAQMNLDNNIIDASMEFLREILGYENDSLLITDKMLRVLVNKGIALPVAIDIMKDIFDILHENGGKNHG